MRAILERVQSASLRRAIQEQGLWDLKEHLMSIVPDLKEQYTSFDIVSDYLLLKVRGMHAFQITLVSEAVRSIPQNHDPLTVVDIGDSAGTHLKYVHELYKEKALNLLSVNVDAEAVKRIREKGLPAVHLQAEDVASYDFKADIFLCFEILEHLSNPIQFLKSLSYKTACQVLVVTVPYVKHSRVGLYQIRKGRPRLHNPENTHIFELCPEDWRILFRHAGWTVMKERLYLQYPRFSPFHLMKWVWRSFDFEGFWGVILSRDHSWSDLYVGAE